MSLVARIFAVCAGGCGLIPFFVREKKTNDLNSAETKNSLFPSEIPEDLLDFQENPELLLGKDDPEEKNCKVIEKLSEDVLWYLGKGEEDYITISCTKTNTDSNEIMPDSWKGLFPKVLFRSQAFHKKGFEFEIKTKTEKLGSESYNTAFSGSSLENSLIVGEWKKETKSSDGKEFITINVLGRLGKTNPIYLLFPEKSPTKV